jgi:uncharacterized protein (UPF0276 family)
MLPALGYTLPTHATDCLKDPAVEAADLVPAQFADATQLSAITSQHPYGLVNIHLGTLALSDNLDAWCTERDAIRQLLGTSWGATVSVSLSAGSPEPTDEAGLKRVLDIVKALQRRFEGARLYLEITPAVKDPATPQRDADFLSEVLQRTGCGWLLNVSEAYARSQNAGFDAYDQIAEIMPSATNVLIRASSVRFEKRIGAVVTTAEGAIPDEVWSLLRHALLLGSHKTRAVVIAGRDLRGGETLRKSDLRHARFIVDRVQGRQRMLRQQAGAADFLARGTIRRA